MIRRAGAVFVGLLFLLMLYAEVQQADEQLEQRAVDVRQ